MRIEAETHVDIIITIPRNSQLGQKNGMEMLMQLSFCDPAPGSMTQQLLSGDWNLDFKGLSKKF